MLSLLSVTNLWAAEGEFAWNLATNSYSSSSASSVVWSNANATMTLSKEISSTNANNHLGGGSNNHTRMYASQVLTFEPATGITIMKVEITATSSTYASNFTNATWSNATGSTSSSISTITPTNGTTSFSGTIGTATRATSVKVYYSSGGGFVAVESVTLDESSITLTEEETQTLTTTVLPADATNKNVTWESSDEDVAIVNAGVITAVGAGDATITCKSVSDNTKSATCAVHVNASPYAKSSLIFIESCGGSGIANDGVEWTVKSDAAESTFDSNRGVHYGTSSKAVSYIKIQTNEINGTIAKVVVNTSGASGTGAVVSVAVDGTAFTIFDDKTTSSSITTTASDYTFTGSASGTILVAITQTSAQKAIYCKSIIVYYEAPAPAAVATPKFSLAAGSYLGAQDIEVTCETQGAEIYYTLDDSDPSSASTHYTGTIQIGTTKTIKAIAIKGDDESAIASATYTIVEVEHAGTEADPYSVADARTIIDVYGSAENVYVSGIVSEIVTAFNPTYGNISYNISSDGLTTSDQLEAFRGKSYNGENFTSADDIKKDDQVVVFGNLTKYNSTYEFAADNQLVSLVRTKAEAGLAYNVTAIEKNIGDAAFTNPLTNPNSLTVTYSSSDENVATVNANGEVTVKGIGTTAIKASFAGNASYLAQEVSFTLSVDDPSLTKVTFDAMVDKTTEDTELSLTKGDLTIAVNNGRFNNSTDYRIYKNAVFTVSCASGNIKRIDFTCTSDYSIIGFADATGLDKNNNQWTGETNTVELITSNKQVRIEKLVVHYVEDTRAASGLEWSTDAIVMIEGETFTPANLINPNNIAASEITIESDNTNLATVSEGVVSLVENVIGDATITAKFAGNATYKPTEFSYTITVKDPTPLIITDPVSFLNFGSTPQDVAVEDMNIEVTLQNVAAATVNITGDGAAAFSASPMALTASGTIVVSANPANIGTFNATLTISDNTGAAENKEISLSLKVLDPADVETPISTASRWVIAEAADIKEGLEVLITSVKGENTYAMGSQANNNRTAVEASISEGVLTPAEGTMSFTLEAQGDNYALRTSNGKYLYAASSSSNHLKTREAINEDGKAVWTISVDDENLASIVANCATANWRNVMQFNPNGTNPPMIACYATASQSPIKLYKKAPIAPVVVDVTSSEVASNIPEGSEVTVEDGGELVVNTTNSFAKLIVKEGGKVILNSKKLTVTGTFAIKTTMGSGKSGELRGVKPTNFAVTGEAYIDITLGDNGNADKWHAFTVPFPVDALNGIYNLDGNKLTNETNYAIMDYHGDIRAQGKYGWKKYRGTLVPGTFYLMTVDGARTTYRMKMKAGSTIVAGNSKAVTAYDGAGENTDKGWNGIGNPTLACGQVNVAVQVLNPESYTYETKDANTCNFIVGTPFFYQAAANGTIVMEDVSGTAYYAPIRKTVKTTEQINVSFANENYTDNLFISASEDATNNYQVGKDLVKMTMTNTPIVPQIFGVAYKTQLSMVHAPLVGDRATYTLNLYAPADGEYTISAQQTEDVIVYLTYEGSPIWNITAGEYNCELQKGNNSGFGLILVRRAPQVTTDIEGATQSQNGVRKLLINGQLFIEKDGKLFNVTGERL